MYNQYFRERYETEFWAGIILSLALFFFYHPIEPFNISFLKYNNKLLIVAKTSPGVFPDQLFGGAKAIDLEVIKKIESDGDALAYNGRTKCYGLYQISQVCLEDFNQACLAAYTPQDLFDPVINEKIARWYFTRLEELLLYFKIPVSGAYLIAAYNWGIGNVVRWHKTGALLESLPQETRNYLEKYKKLALNSQKILKE